jgi:formiminotetrahydrofolate cyclodeaminase
MKKYYTLFKDYLDGLSEKDPSLGGGSAVCLVFCLGISLIEKAINYSPKNKARLKDSLQILKRVKKEVLPYIDLDGKIFEKALKERNRKKKRSFLKNSQNLIINVGKSCWRVFSLAKNIESGIKKNIISDFHIGLRFVKIALEGCVLNLEANKRIFGIDSKYIKNFKNYLKKWQ